MDPISWDPTIGVQEPDFLRSRRTRLTGDAKKGTSYKCGGVDKCGGCRFVIAHNDLGAYRLGAYGLGAYSLGRHIWDLAKHGLEGLQSRATDSGTSRRNIEDSQM